MDRVRSLLSTPKYGVGGYLHVVWAEGLGPANRIVRQSPSLMTPSTIRITLN
jgi:hypothetical protein